MNTPSPASRPLLTRLVAAVISVAAMLGISISATAPASAYEPVGIVHTETVVAGPYEVTVGFSVWPLRAMRSLDFTFVPSGGITDKSGTMNLSGPQADSDLQDALLQRHPRKLEVWGLDVVALTAPGSYSIDFEIVGPEGVGRGTLENLSVLDQPGPPIALSWTVASLPFLALVVLIGVSWRRTRPGKQPLVL